MSKTWTVPLCGCFSECGACLCAACVPLGICCVQGKAVDIANREGACVPCLFACLCGCFGCALNRGKIRYKLDIQGSFLADLCCWVYCPLCVAVQELREAKNSH